MFQDNYIPIIIPRQTRHGSANPISLLRQYTGHSILFIHIYLLCIYMKDDTELCKTNQNEVIH